MKCQSELNASGLTLGELLKKKAESGVRVLIMIWGETTSIMGTHDTETENYFKGGELVRLVNNARKDLFHNIIHSHSKIPIIHI